MPIVPVRLRNVVDRSELTRADWPRLDAAGYPMISCFVGNEVVLEFKFQERLVLLVSGKALVRTTLQTDALVEHLRSSSQTWVLWPEWLYGLMNFISSLWRKS